MHGLYQEDFTEVATPRGACREYALNCGRDGNESAWILTPYDTWEPNPFYKGPRQSHPEDDDYSEEE